MVISPGRATVPKRLPAGKRRQQLLDVALRLFATNGYNATTMDEIAEAAGVTKPLLYQHFESKRALYLELVDTVATTLLTAIASATEAASPRQQVEGGFGAYFHLVVTHADAFRLLFDSATPDDAELSGMLRHVEDVLAAAISPLIDAGLDDDHRQLLAYAVVGMAEGASRYLLANGVPGSSDTGDAGAGIEETATGAPARVVAAGHPDGTATGASGLDAGNPSAGNPSAGSPSAGNPADQNIPGTAGDHPVATRLASRLADLAWAGLRSVHRD